MSRPTLATTAKTMALRGLFAASLPFARNAPPHLKRELRSRAFSGSLADPRHRERIAYDCVEETPAMQARREASEAVAGYTAAEDWRSVARLLEAWDQSGAKSHDDKRLFIQGLETFTHVVLPEAGYGAVRPYKMLARLDSMFDHHPQEYGLAALAVWLRVRTAWGVRGCGFTHQISDRDWAEIGDLMEGARRYLDLDAVRTSPLLAYAALNTVPFVACNGENVKASWAQYADLAPDCTWGHEHFGEWMQPKWYGDTQNFDVTARQAMARTESVAGATAYACMYTAAASDEAWILCLKHLNELIHGIDTSTKVILPILDFDNLVGNVILVLIDNRVEISGPAGACVNGSSLTSRQLPWVG